MINLKEEVLDRLPEFIEDIQHLEIAKGVAKEVLILIHNKLRDTPLTDDEHKTYGYDCDCNPEWKVYKAAHNNLLVKLRISLI